MDNELPHAAGRPVRVEDVAREAGVSPITVSRALGAPHKVRAETRARVMEAVARTGYVVDSIASSLRSGRSSIVAVFVASLESRHFASAVQGALDAFEQSRFRLLFAQTGHGEAVRPDDIEAIRPFRPAALMFTGVRLDAAARAAIGALELPVIEVWSDSAEAVDMAAGASIAAGARLVGAHFAERGYRRVGYCGHTHGPGSAGLRGFREGYEGAGRRVGHVQPLEGAGTFRRGMLALDAICAALPACDAIFFDSDVLAAGALARAAERGIAVPAGLAIAGYGDLDFAAHTAPPLTSIRVSDYETGRLAGAMLRGRLEGQAPAEPVIQVPMELVLRASTATVQAELSPHAP